MNDTENLSMINKGNPRWVKGVSANPLGRPKKVKCIPDILRKIGDMIAPQDIQKKMQRRFYSKDKLTMQQAVLMLTYDLAAHGTEWAVEFIAARTEGKVTQPVDMNAVTGPLVAILNAPQGDQHVAVTTPAAKPTAPVGPDTSADGPFPVAVMEK